jgi:ATP-dependent 26S proteasome regulatory subunit
MLHQYLYQLPNSFEGDGRTSIRPGDTVIVPNPNQPNQQLLCIAWTTTSNAGLTSDLLGHFGEQVYYPPFTCRGPNMSTSLLRCISKSSSTSTTTTNFLRVPTENALRVSLVYPSKYRQSVPSISIGRRVSQLLEGKVIASGFEIKLPAGSLEDFTLVVRSTQPSACAVRITTNTRVIVNYDTELPPSSNGGSKKLAAGEAATTTTTTTTTTTATTATSATVNVVGEHQQPLDGPAKEIQELLLAPVMWSKKLQDYHIQLPRGVLLSGPPGVGKTRSIRMACNSCRFDKTGIHVELYAINGADLFATNNVGGAASILRSIFQKARLHVESSIYSVSCIFIDEIDVVCPSRDRNDGGNHNAETVRIVAQLLTLMDGVDDKGVTKIQQKARERIIICAATNRPNVLDSALRRPGRFDYEIHFKPPNVEERLAILQNLVRLPLTPPPPPPPPPKTPPPQTPPPPTPPPTTTTTWFSQLTRFYIHVGNPIGKNGTLKSSKENVLKVLKKYKDQERRLFQELFRRYKLSQEEISTYDLHVTSTLPTTEQKQGEKKNTTSTTVNTTHNSELQKIAPLTKSPQLQPQQKRGVPIAKDVILLEVATSIVGYTGADIQALLRGAAMRAVESNRSIVTMDDISSAMATITPSSMRGHTIQKRVVKWDELGGLRVAKLKIQKSVVWPIQRASIFKRVGAKPPRGILLHGPPGCGKTSLVLALANEVQATFLTLTPSDVYSAYVGDSERSIRSIFARARSCIPALLFLDEIDAIVGSRGLDGSSGGGTSDLQARVLSTLLNEMDGVSSADGLIVVGATNRLESIDPALLRPGRLGQHICVGLPNLEDRLDILKVCSKTIPMSSVDLKTISESTENWSGAEIRGLCREAAMFALRNNRLEVTQVDMTNALKELTQTKE